MLPRIAVLDDLFGRELSEGRNPDRENLCAHFLWRDVTGDSATLASGQRVLKPTAEVCFHRAQSPTCARVGDLVENDLDGALAFIRSEWAAIPSMAGDGHSVGDLKQRPSMLLLDLCFYTGIVTDESDRRASGMPVGRPDDAKPRSYFGLKLLEAIHREIPDLPIFILSSMPRDPVALAFSQRGALGFLDRSAADSPAKFKQALAYHGLLPDAAGSVVGRSLPILLALREARRAAQHGHDVLIRGERGTGKELIAQYLHRISAEGSESRARALVAINAPGLAPSMYTSELFGIEPRSATNVDGRIGLIETAEGGDVFLDEVADLAPEVQASLLRVIQERQITRVGARAPSPVNVRFIAATNVDVDEPGSALRRDLLDRLKTGGTIWLPPLRERVDDIPLLVEKFVRDAEGRKAATLRRQITSDALARLQSHDWPGNIRELQTVIADAVNQYCDVEYLLADHLRIGPAASSLAVQVPSALPRESASSVETSYETLSLSLDELMLRSASLTFGVENMKQWAGRLDAVQSQQQQLIARLLQGAIDATKRRTPENLSGKVLIRPTMRLATGNQQLTATQAADLVKRLLGPLEESLQGDLKALHKKAVDLRKPGKPGKPALDD